MKVLLSVIAATLTFAANAAGSHSTKGYVKKDGTYVAPSGATNPNQSKADNYSSKGNVNPYTGKAGTKAPAAPARPAKP
jgi:hypothetical protein